MPILTLDDAVSGAVPPLFFSKTTGTMEAAGTWNSLAYAVGDPGPATASADGLAGAALTAYAGQMPFGNPGGGDETRLFGLSVTSAGLGTLLLYDRLWHNSSIVVSTTTAQTINSVAFPARDRNGSVNGDGVMVAIEVSTATGNGGATTNCTLSYTNSAGTAGRTATITIPATATAGTLVFFQLQGGDTGVRSIQSITLGTTLVSGAIHLVALRPLAFVGNASANSSADRDFLQLSAVKLFDNSVPMLAWKPAATTSVVIDGILSYTQG